ncbi:response regulator [Micromonospora chalcea]
MLNPEVLFVDDDLTLAEGYARAIRGKLAIECLATDEPSVALRAVRDGSIRVAVLDQRMPVISGIDLMAEIHKVDPKTRVIILSGLASDREIVQAYDGGVAKFLRKEDWRDQLAPAVEGQLVDYEGELSDEFELAVAAEEPIFETRIGLPIFGQKVSYCLLSSEIVDEEFVFASSWRTVGRIDAGVETEISFDVEWKSVKEKVSKLGTVSRSETGLSIGKSAKLSMKISDQISSSDEFRQLLERREKVTTRRKVVAPAEPSDPNDLHVRARSYEVAPVFIFMRATLLRRCGTCQSTKLIKMDAYLPRARYATRQIDYMSDNSSPRIMRTGSHDLV